MSKSVYLGCSMWLNDVNDALVLISRCVNYIKEDSGIVEPSVSEWEQQQMLIVRKELEIEALQEKIAELEKETSESDEMTWSEQNSLIIQQQLEIEVLEDRVNELEEANEERLAR